MNDDKIQTGLRIPISRYAEIKEMADRSGTSVNSIILLLVDVGLRVISAGVEQVGRDSSHILQCTREQHTRPDY